MTTLQRSQNQKDYHKFKVSVPKILNLKLKRMLQKVMRKGKGKGKEKEKEKGKEKIMDLIENFKL